MESIIERVGGAASLIIAEKKAEGKAPFSASQWEIIQRMANATSGEVLEAMRELHRQKTFKAHIDINMNPTLEER